MAKAKVIIDTDPGCDDVIALLYALASDPSEIEVAMVSVTYGNVGAEDCLQNVISMFHIIEKEMQWRKSQGIPPGFEMLQRMKPLVAVGAKGPLGSQTLMADYYHGFDGLGGVSTSHPQYNPPAETWKHLFEPPASTDLLTSTAISTTQAIPPTKSGLFTPSYRPAPTEILAILSSNPPDTITLIAIGPLTNFATAAAIDPHTFMRAKHVLVMGGTIDLPGNITAVGEFNCIADPIAAARLYALTSPTPSSTMPPSAPHVLSQQGADLPDYPPKEKLGDKRLNVILFPLDITTPHLLRRDEMEAVTVPLTDRGSPLAGWVGAFMDATFRLNEALYTAGEAAMALHDPLPIWYALDAPPPLTHTQKERSSGTWAVKSDEDIRIETAGQWTRGMCVVDRRGMTVLSPERDDPDGDEVVGGDSGHWRSRWRGNRLGRCVGTPGERMLAGEILKVVFG